VSLRETLGAWLSLPESIDDPWQPIPQKVLIVACAFYGLFLLQAALGSGPLLMIDLVFVPVHEGGHLFFGYFGEFIGIAGGTIMQLGVPLALAAYFFVQRQIQGTAFCVFFFFEQFLPISVYMADARAEELPLISVGHSDDVIHDWNYLFGKLGWLAHDKQIAHVVHFLGWMGMLAIVGWMIWQSLASTEPGDAPSPSEPTASAG
jgi:hypothetical protein